MASHTKQTNMKAVTNSRVTIINSVIFTVLLATPTVMAATATVRIYQDSSDIIVAIDGSVDTNFLDHEAYLNPPVLTKFELSKADSATTPEYSVGVANSAATYSRYSIPSATTNFDCLAESVSLTSEPYPMVAASDSTPTIGFSLLSDGEAKIAFSGPQNTVTPVSGSYTIQGYDLEDETELVTGSSCSVEFDGNTITFIVEEETTCIFSSSFLLGWICKIKNFFSWLWNLVF